MDTITLLTSTNYVIELVPGLYSGEIHIKLLENLAGGSTSEVLLKDGSTSPTFPMTFTTSAGIAAQSELCSDPG